MRDTGGLELQFRGIKDRGVLITGAGRGIGKRLAIGFAANGAKVGLLARTKAELDLAHLEIEHAGGVSLRLRADVRDYDQIASAVRRMNVHFGGVHVLVCAAAVLGPIGPLEESTPEEWAGVLLTNVAGVANACRAVLPQMKERRAGKIIVLAGPGATKARPYHSAYAASKAGVVRLVETLAAEVADHNIQVNCMSPGGTYTHMTDQVLRAGERAGRKSLEEAKHIRESGGVPPDKQIELALFLASHGSNHISGRLLRVQDDWKKLEHTKLNPESYVLRRIERA